MRRPPLSRRSSVASMNGTAIQPRCLLRDLQDPQSASSPELSLVWVSHKRVVTPKTLFFFFFNHKYDNAPRNFFSSTLTLLLPLPPSFCASLPELSDLVE